MDLIKVDPREYNLEETKAKQISEVFKPMLDKMEALESEYNEIIKLELNEETSKAAKELRLKYVKVRTGTAEIHKKQKAFYRQGGLFIDGWKNAQLFASQNIEDKLLEIEKYQENLERERIKAITEERLAIVRQYDPEFNVMNIGEYSVQFWNSFILGVKTAHEETKKQKEVEEQLRLQAELDLVLHNERKEKLIPVWKFLTEDLKTENFGTWDEEMFEGLYQELREKEMAEESERLAAKLKAEEAEAKKKQLEAELEKQKQEAEAKLLKAQQEQKKKEAEQLKIAEKKRLEAEAVQKKLDDLYKQKEEEERIAALKIEDEAKKDDGQKMIDLLNDIDLLKTKYSFKSKQNIKIMSDIVTMFDKINIYVKQQAAKSLTNDLKNLNQKLF